MRGRGLGESDPKDDESMPRVSQYQTDSSISEPMCFSDRGESPSCSVLTYSKELEYVVRAGYARNL